MLEYFCQFASHGNNQHPQINNHSQNNNNPNNSNSSLHNQPTNYSTFQHNTNQQNPPSTQNNLLPSNLPTSPTSIPPTPKISHHSNNTRRDSLKLQHQVLNFPPLKNWTSFSDSGLKLELIEQPCAEHRARYATEGAKGVIKAADQNTYPTLRLSGYKLNENLGPEAQEAIAEYNRNNPVHRKHEVVSNGD